MSIDYDEDDDELKFIARHVVNRNSSSNRKSKGNLRIDPNQSVFDDLDTSLVRIVGMNSSIDRKNRYNVIHDDVEPVETFLFPPGDTGQKPGPEESMMTFDQQIDNESTRSSDISDDVLEEIDGIKVRTGNRTKSIEDILSVMNIDDNERIHFLDNFKQILNHESRHLVLLNTISKFKYILKESKVSDEVLLKIFCNIDELIDAQTNLVLSLEQLIADWDLNKHLFIDMMDLYESLHTLCKKYVMNIAEATTELRSLFEKNEKFIGALHMVVFEGSPLLLEVLIAKPTNWLCNSLENIKSIIETSEGQCDVKMIRVILEKLKDNAKARQTDQNSSIEKNVLVRSAMFIEILPNDQRQLRHVFLFSGMLVCTKQRLQRDVNTPSKLSSPGSREVFSPNKAVTELKSIERLEVKWFIPLVNLVVHQSQIMENTGKRKVELSNLKDKIRDLRMQFLSEKAKVSESEVPISPGIRRTRSFRNNFNFSFRNIIIKKDVDKIQNQIIKAQKDLMKLWPTISFLVSDLSEKPHNFLVFSVKDLELWKRDIMELKKEVDIVDQSNISLTALSNFLESYRGNSSIIDVANTPLPTNIYDEGVTGVIATTIESVDGLNPAYSYYLSIEVDSFNLNEVQATTKQQSNDSSLFRNESFDIDLDCSHTLNILLHQVKNDAGEKELFLGYFEFKLDVEDLNNKTVTKTTPNFGEDSTVLQINASFKMKTRNDLMKRQPSLTKSELFGVSLESVIAREKSKCNVPMFLSVCLKKIEDDGLDLEGIYRISGNKNDISEFYKRLNKSVINALKEIGNYDLHTITGTVKLYLRELPEPLMLSDNYKRLLQISNVADEEERYILYTDLIQKLPEPNQSTVIHILKHFKRVVEHSDKNHMVSSNLGLIIGPTLILPPVSPDRQSLTNFAQETMNSIYLCRVFTQLMNGVCTGAVVLDQSSTNTD